MSKPVVHYIGEATFSIWPWHTNEDGSNIIVAHLPEVIDHPKLGHCFNVRTSNVIIDIDDDGKFATLNTIYEPYKNS